MKLIEIYHQFFRISGDDGVYYCTNADTDAALNVKAVHHVRTDATELPYDFRMLPPLTLRGRDIEKIKPLHKGLGMPYTPISKRVNILKTQTPDSMGYESHRALDKLQKAVGGDTTNFVCERLQWTREQIKERLFAEQVDAVALIIYNFEARHQSVIIGDQTGIGKGRVASSIIRYAVVQGLIPVYCTENTGLFSDNYRDLCDIGCSDLVPFIINSSTSGKTDASIKTLDENDKQVTVYRPIADKKVKEKIYKSGKMPKGYDYILTTYSQLKNAYHKEKGGTITDGEDYLKYSFLKDIAPNAVFIFDESHNISGSKIVQRDWWDPDPELVLAGSNQFTCFNELCKASANSVFLSATFAKQPQNMIIYANRTCIAEAGLQESELVGAIAKGGEALQEIISANIVSEGQMIRRESIYKDIEVNYITLNADNALQYGTPDLEKEHRGMCDYITDLLNQINEFEQTYVMPVIEQMNETDTADIHTSKTDQKLGVGHTPLFSKLFQIVNQLLFAIKAEAVAEHAIRRLGEGKKVVIAVSSTMEAFIKSLEDDDNKGEEISCDFALVLDRALENTLKIVRNGEGDFHEKDTIAIDLLPPEGQDMYMAIRENIVNAVSNICISPIDLIISRIENAINPETGENYIVTEVTGRAKKIQFSNPECTSGYIVPRPPVKRNVAFSEFQNNQSDVLIINTSGATGASAHATVKNTNLRPDQVKPRCMIIAQTELDIDKEVQKRGRVNRTGQIYLPTYDYLISAIPAEQRLMMMLQKKLKSLDANSTSNQKQSTNIIDVLDFFNKYGDQVAYEYLEENPDINRKLNNPLGLDKNGDKPKSNSDAAENVKKKDFVKRISGYVPLLTCEEQADFYDSVSSNYKKLVDELKKKGEYDLEVESMDLDAKLIGSLKILQPSSSGNSCFSDAVYQGIYSCKVLRKPYTKEQVAMFIHTNTQGGDAKAMAKQTADEYADYYEKKKQQAIDEITKKAEEHKQSAKEVEERKGGTAQVIEQAINQKWLEIDNETAETIKNRSFKFDALKHRARFIKFFYAGRACIIEGDHDTKAICLGTEIGNKTKNKFSPSNITITFAVANSIKEMSLTLVDKDITQLQAIMGLSTLDEYADSRFLENWSEYVKESTADREQRNIIVGNLLKGYKNAPEKSKLISFTTHEGEVMKGILTPKDTDSSNTAKVIAAKYSIKECGWVIMDTIRGRNSKNFTLTRGMEIRTNPNGTITLVCTQSDTHKHLKDDTEWQQISDSGRGFDVQTQNGKNIWLMSVSDPARLLDLLEKYNISVEFFPTEAQLYFGDRGNDALKQGDWTPLPTDPTNIPTWNYISPLLENEIKLLKLKFGGSPLSGPEDFTTTQIEYLDLTDQSKGLYSKNVKLSLPKIKQHYADNLLNRHFFNEDKGILVSVTQDSFDETFWGMRNGKPVYFTKYLILGIHFLPDLIREMKYIGRTKCEKKSQTKLNGTWLLTFEVAVKFGEKLCKYSIPVLEINDGKTIQYSIRIKNKKTLANTAVSNGSATLRGIGEEFSCEELLYNSAAKVANISETPNKNGEKLSGTELKANVDSIMDASNYDSKHINNLAPDKKIPYSIIENLDKKGMTLENIDRITSEGFPVCKYMTQITVHGICPTLKSEYVGSYKCLTVNQNKSLGIRWIGIDDEKKTRLATIAYKIRNVVDDVKRDEYEMRVSPHWYYRKDSQSAMFYSYLGECEHPAGYFHVPSARQKAEVAKIQKELHDKLKGHFFGSVYTAQSRAYLYLCISISGIYEKDIPHFISSVFGYNQAELDNISAEYDRRKAEAKKKEEQENQEREAREKHREECFKASLPQFQKEFNEYKKKWMLQHPIPNGFVKPQPSDMPQKGDIICYYDITDNPNYYTPDEYKAYENPNPAYKFDSNLFERRAELRFKVFYQSFGKMCYCFCDENGVKPASHYDRSSREYGGGFQPYWYVKRASGKTSTAHNSAAAVPGTPAALAIIHYTDKAIVLTGDTKPFKDQIKALGGKFGSHFDTSKVPSGIGWLFPKTKLAEVQAFVAKHGETTASPLFDNEIALLKLKSGK